MAVWAHRGFEQFYDRQGSGPDLIWSHGLYMSADKDEAFFGFFPQLRQRFRLFTFDARGHGRSSPTLNPDDYTWDALAADLRSLLEAVGPSRAAWIGGSMGAMTALTCVSQTPSSARAMVLFQPTAVGTDLPRVERLSRAFSAVMGGQGMEAAAELLMSMGPWAALAEREPERVATLQRSFATQHVEALQTAIRGITRPPGFDRDRLEQLRDLQVPILLLADPDDPTHPRASAEQLHAVLPRSELIVAPRNFYFFSHPDEMRALMEQFLEGHPEG